MNVCGTAAEVEVVAGGLARELAVDATVLDVGMPAEVTAVLERAWWYQGHRLRAAVLHGAHQAALVD
ncbi:hypothetical protein ACFQV4_01270 [Streptomyces thermocarboxydus]